MRILGIACPIPEYFQMQPDGKGQSPFRFFQDILYRRSPGELRTIAHIKRFFECFAGDPEFRKLMTDSPATVIQEFRSRGIDLDPVQLAPLWENGPCMDMEKVEFNGSLLGGLWVQWIRDHMEFRELMRSRGNARSGNERFNAWRLRQVARCDGELGDTKHAIVHAVLAFELSRGCSVGCWFCGFDAGRLEAVFPYSPENADLWSHVLQACVEIFGEAAETGICYHATEPSDNPDYFKFLDDFERIVGVLPQTTSAAPLKDPGWTRQLVRLCNDRQWITSRFSILNVKTLRRLHAEFSAEELLRIQLVQQNAGSMVMKARAGRAAQHGDINSGIDLPPQVATDLGTIACISGFLVNMVDRTIRLVSPCRSSERWPLGYRVHAQGIFENAREFKTFIEKTIETCVPENLAGDAMVRLRHDLRYTRREDGFTLSTDYQAHKFSGGAMICRIGEMVAGGSSTAGEIIGELIGQGEDLFAVVGVLRSLFDRGLLDDGPSRIPDSR